MTAFRIPGKLQHHTCTECAQGFTSHREDSTICSECGFYQSHPELAPKRWTWSMGSNQWGVVAFWPEKEDLPQPGDIITVHRKDETTSVETIAEVRNTNYTPAARLRVLCTIA